MKGINLKQRFFLKLSTVAAVPLLLFAQQAFAVGTTAGTDIDNLAIVDYTVGGVNQTDIESAPGPGNANPGVGNGTPTSFEVDNRVDFTLTEVGGAHTVVNVGDTDQFVEYLLTNLGNSAQDFRLVATQLNNPEAIFGLDDTDDDIGNLRVTVGTNGNPAGAPPGPTDPNFVDELGEGESVIIRLYGDDLGGLVDNDVMNIDLVATVAAADGSGGSLGADLVDGLGVADDPTAIDIVFADGAALGDGTETERHGFVFRSAGLTVTKVANIVSDPFNTSAFKAVPGAVIEYTITVSNSGSLPADLVVITDAIDADIPAVPGLIRGFYGGQDLSVVNDGGSALGCIADADATDGCTLSGQDLTIGGGTTPITIAAAPGGGGTTDLVIIYRVTIP